MMILEAIKANDLSKVRELIAESPDVVLEKYGRGYTILQEAAWRSDLAMLEILFSAGIGAHINEPDQYGLVPLTMAASGNPSLEVIKYLISQGADIWYQEKKHGGTVLSSTAWNANFEVFRFFLEQGLDLKIDVHQGKMLANAASPHANADIFRYLVARKEELEFNQEIVTEALFQGAENPEVEIVETLLSLGADVNARNYSKDTPLMIAANYNNNVDVLKRLVAAGAKVNLQDYQKNKAIHHAARFNENVDVLKYLVSLDTNIGCRNVDWETIMHCAAGNRNPDVLDFVIGLGLDVNAKNRLGFTPLHKAADWAEQFSVFSSLIHDGAAINETNLFHQTPLDRVKDEKLQDELRAVGAKRGSELPNTLNYWARHFLMRLFR